MALHVLEDSQVEITALLLALLEVLYFLTNIPFCGEDPSAMVSPK
jgi:hypothetical protein